MMSAQPEYSFLDDVHVVTKVAVSAAITIGAAGTQAFPVIAFTLDAKHTVLGEVTPTSHTYLMSHKDVRALLAMMTSALPEDP
jgi:hypothetical protein